MRLPTGENMVTQQRDHATPLRLTQYAAEAKKTFGMPPPGRILVRSRVASRSPCAEKVVRLMPADIAEALARRLTLSRERVLQVCSLLDAGLHAAFIAHYRKGATGGMDEATLQRLIEARRELLDVENLRQRVGRQIAQAGVVDECGQPGPYRELREEIQAATETAVLEDIDRPFKPRRRTAGLVAYERGLGGLADYAWKRQPEGPDLPVKAAEFVNPDKEVRSPQESLAGASHILAERIAEDFHLRHAVRRFVWDRGILKCRQAKQGGKGAAEFKGYFQFQEAVNRLPPHRILAINRGERSKALKVTLEVPMDDLKKMACDEVMPVEPDAGASGYVRTCAPRSSDAGSDERKAFALKNPHLPEHRFRPFLEAVVADALERLVLPTVEREVRRDLTDRAEAHAIDVFAANMRSLLMARPVRGKRVLAIQPGYRTGCKVAVLDAAGALVGETIIYPLEPQDKWDEGKAALLAEIQRHAVQTIAIGNGTGCREVEQLVSEAIEQSGLDLQYAVVSEAGAAVYADSDLARQEFPNLDAAIRATVSIGRRLQDPLAEMVKIDPRAIGVGLYQHDVNQQRLKGALEEVMVSCVAAVGADAHTAAPAMLRYVPGLRPEHVQALCARRARSPLAFRADLRTLPGWDEPTFVAAAGFLRVHGDNALDATRVHPESYAAAERLLEKVGHRLQDLKAPASAQAVRQHLTGIALEPLAAELNLPLPDLAELVGALQKPDADPRQQHHGPIFRNKIRRIEDLAPGMWVKGTVRNVVDFGAFVDIGLKEDGLIHISQFSKRYVRNPLKFLHVGDVVDARIVSIDTGKHRIALTLISEEPKKGGAPPAAGPEGQAAARPARPRRTGPARRGPRPAPAAPSAEGGPSAPAHGAPAPAPQRRAAPGQGAGGRRPPRAPQRGEGAPAQGAGDRFRRGRRPTRTGPPRIIISKSQADLKDRGADEKGRPKIRWAQYESDPNEEEWVDEEAESPAEGETTAQGETTQAQAESPAETSAPPAPAETPQPAAETPQPAAPAADFQPDAEAAGHVRTYPAAPAAGSTPSPQAADPTDPPQADPAPPQSGAPPNHNV